MKNILLEVEANLHFVFGSSVKLDNNSHEDVTSPWLVFYLYSFNLHGNFVLNERERVR